MHKYAYQVGRPPSREARCSSFLVILTKSYTIPPVRPTKTALFCAISYAQTEKPPPTRCRNAKEPSHLKDARVLARNSLSTCSFAAAVSTALAAEAALDLWVSARLRRDARRTRQQGEPGYRVAPVRILPAQRCTRPFHARGTSAL